MRCCRRRKVDAEEGGLAKKKNKEKIKTFPCCFEIPLDIAMMGFALVDILFFTAFALLWWTVISFELFEGRNQKKLEEQRDKETRSLPYDVGSRALAVILSRSISGSQGRDLPDDEDFVDTKLFRELDTTLNPDMFVPDNDKRKVARSYSVIAHYATNGGEISVLDQSLACGQNIDKNCGMNYFEDYLYLRGLNGTRTSFETVAGIVMASSFLFAIIGCILMVTLCCFRGYIATKVLIMVLCYIQLIPIIMMIWAAVLSQSKRFCVLEFGIPPPTCELRGQTLMLVLIMLPIVTYKPYELFIWANYIRRYFKNKDGKLLNESYFCPARMEARHQKALAENMNTRGDLGHFDHSVGRADLFKSKRKEHHETENRPKQAIETQEEGSSSSD